MVRKWQGGTKYFVVISSATNGACTVNQNAGHVFSWNYFSPQRCCQTNKENASDGNSLTSQKFCTNRCVALVNNYYVDAIRGIYWALDASNLDIKRFLYISFDNSHNLNVINC